MNGNKLPSPCPEVAAFRRFYNDLLGDVRYPAKLAKSLLSAGIISREAKDSITSASTYAGQRRAVLDALEHALLQSSVPSAIMESLPRAFILADLPTRYFHDMERFVDGEYIRYR